MQDQLNKFDPLPLVLGEVLPRTVQVVTYGKRRAPAPIAKPYNPYGDDPRFLAYAAGRDPEDDDDDDDDEEDDDFGDEDLLITARQCLQSLATLTSMLYVRGFLESRFCVKELRDLNEAAYPALIIATRKKIAELKRHAQGAAYYQQFPDMRTLNELASSSVDSSVKFKDSADAIKRFYAAEDAHALKRHEQGGVPPLVSINVDAAIGDLEKVSISYRAAEVKWRTTLVDKLYARLVDLTSLAYASGFVWGGFGVCDTAHLPEELIQDFIHKCKQRINYYSMQRHNKMDYPSVGTYTPPPGKY